MSDDILQRFQNKQRPKVSRDASIAVEPQTVNTSVEVATAKDLPEFSSSSLRVEKQYYEQMNEFCRTHRITRDTLLEAAYLLAQENESFKKKLVETARTHCTRRKVAKEERKLNTMLQNRGRQS